MYNADLDHAALADLRSDAKGAREQALNGPFYPEKGITAESLLAYAERCEKMIEAYSDGGAHNAALRGY
jgi:hypothetical protein